MSNQERQFAPSIAGETTESGGQTVKIQSADGQTFEIKRGVLESLARLSAEDLSRLTGGDLQSLRDEAVDYNRAKQQKIYDDFWSSEDLKNPENRKILEKFSEAVKEFGLKVSVLKAVLWNLSGQRHPVDHLHDFLDKNPNVKKPQMPKQEINDRFYDLDYFLAYIYPFFNKVLEQINSGDRQVFDSEGLYPQVSANVSRAFSPSPDFKDKDSRDFLRKMRDVTMPYVPVAGESNDRFYLYRVIRAVQYFLEAFPVEFLDADNKRIWQDKVCDANWDANFPETDNYQAIVRSFHESIAKMAEALKLRYVPVYLDESRYDTLPAVDNRHVRRIGGTNEDFFGGKKPSAVDQNTVIRINRPFLTQPPQYEGGKESIYTGLALLPADEER